MPDKSWFDYFVSVVAILTGAYTLHKNFFERAKVSLIPGDRMAIVRGPGGARRIHLRAVLINDAAKIGTLQRLEAEITKPGTPQVRTSGPPQPIPIPSKNSQPLLAQLELIERDTPPKWVAGRHRVKVLGWVNRRSRSRRANVESIFHIDISTTLALALPKDQSQYAFEDVQVEEWSGSV